MNEIESSRNSFNHNTNPDDSPIVSNGLIAHGVSEGMATPMTMKNEMSYDRNDRLESLDPNRFEYNISNEKLRENGTGQFHTGMTAENRRENESSIDGV